MNIINNISTSVGIIADDLTSAADAAGPFVAHGLSSNVCRRVIDENKVEVLSIDTASRILSESEAAKAVEQATAKLASRSLLFKTVDSTLRGHVRAELNAAYQAAFGSGSYQNIVIAPAFPEAGRITVGGIQLVDGIPVSESAYGNDPVHPAATSRIADLVDPTLGKCIVVPSTASREEICSVAKEARVLILDAESQEALNRQVARIPNPNQALWVGSPGMAQALATLFPVHLVQPQIPTANRVLIIVGSANPVSRQQCQLLSNKGIPLVSQAEDIPEACSIVCLSAPETRCDDPKAVLQNLISEAAKAVNRYDFDAIVATGGETMDAVLERLFIQYFTLIGELEPGFPVGKATRGDTQAPLVLAMKAGGFGQSSTLLDAAYRLHSSKKTNQKVTI